MGLCRASICPVCNTDSKTSDKAKVLFPRASCSTMRESRCGLKRMFRTALTQLFRRCQRIEHQARVGDRRVRGRARSRAVGGGNGCDDLVGQCQETRALPTSAPRRPRGGRVCVSVDSGPVGWFARHPGPRRRSFTPPMSFDGGFCLVTVHEVHRHKYVSPMSAHRRAPAQCCQMRPIRTQCGAVADSPICLPMFRVGVISSKGEGKANQKFSLLECFAG